MDSIDVDPQAAREAARPVEIPYRPRKHFLPMHRSKKRFKFVVAHRRAGKSVSEFNELLRRALMNDRPFPPPRYAYVGPSFAQTKDLIWGYAKEYCGAIPGVQFNESDLKVSLPNGATITLYGGASAYERMRGLYFDGIVLDEFPLLAPSVFSTVVRPCLADYRGFAIVSGTVAGDDHFHALKKKNENNPDWDIFIIPVTQTDALDPDEVREMTQDMSPSEYAREMLCDFNAPVEGSYYADLFNEAELETPPRVTSVPYDPKTRVYTFWDLGIDDATAIWFVQKVGMEYHFIDYDEASGLSLTEWAVRVKEKPYLYGTHVFPHDIKARELSTGRTRWEIVSELFDDVYMCPIHRVEDGIEAVRSIIPISWYDKEKCSAGIMAARNYTKTKTGKPKHNWASHGADAKRVCAMAIDQVAGFGGPAGRGVGALKRGIRGLT